ncbi:hypothetical protein [Diplocloster hominis]|uniref:hypothetical protein n=1 Tax=Diplocloster hominis TaxID=3079010 RepID=UPI0031B9F21E
MRIIEVYAQKNQEIPVIADHTVFRTGMIHKNIAAGKAVRGIKGIETAASFGNQEKAAVIWPEEIGILFLCDTETLYVSDIGLNVCKAQGKI